jgi:putative flavoprotein involved in K+ transport
MAPHSISADVTAWLGSFGAALTEGNLDSALSLFGESCFWRDMVTFTWNIKTAEGKEEIRAMLEATLPDAQPTDWQIEGEAMEVFGAINAFFKFETSVGRGRGHLRLMDGKCFTLLTTLYELKGFEEKVGAARPIGRGVSPEPNRETQGGRMKREQEELGHSKQPYVVIVGGGHSGVMLAARLRVLNVPTIVVEKGRPGNSWRKRYSSLHLHTPKSH